MAVQQPMLASLESGPVLEGVVLDRSPAIVRPLRSGWLGVKVCLVPIEPVQARRLGQTAGLGIQRVSKGSPAARSGVRKTDLLLSVNDVATDTEGALRRALAGRMGGETVRLRLMRDRRLIEIVAEVSDVSLPC